MDITSFVLGMKLGGGDKEASDFNLKLASAVLTRDASYLGDSTTLNIPSFKLPDGNLFGTASSYVYAGFDEVKHIKIDRTALISDFAFAGDKQLELIDVSSYMDLGTLVFYPHSLEGIARQNDNGNWDFPLKTIICRPDKGYSIKNVYFFAGSLPDVPSGFEKPYVYVPAADYDTVASKWMTDGDIPLSHLRKLEDYPEIDRWNEKYTVRFFDGDTLLNTKIVKYGASASYTPTKEGYVFAGWDKDVSKVTEDMDVYAVWRLDFATASWQTISQVVNDGRAAEEFQLGDTKTVTLTYADGTTEDVEFQIASLDCDELYSSLTDNRICMIAKHVLDTPKIWDTKANADTNYESGKAIANYILNDLTPSFPDDLKSVWKTLGRVSYGGATDVWGTGNSDYVLLPSDYAITGLHNPTPGSNPTSASKYERLPLFKDKSNEFAVAYSNNICKTRDGTAVNYWTSSTYKPSTSNYKIPEYITTAGKLAYASDYSTVARYIRPAFFV